MQSVTELLAHALAIETEAGERYAELAAQMQAHNNEEVAALFRRLAVIEGKHAEHIRARAGALALPALPPWEYRWRDPEAPETAEFDRIDYLTSAHEALLVAKHNEQRAVEFFDGIARNAPDPQVRTMAAELADDERGHVRLVSDWLARHPQIERDDPDPPVSQD